MSLENLRRRAAQLEHRPVSARKLCAALRHYRATGSGELPADPRLRAVIEKVAEFDKQARERRRVEEPPSGHP